MIIFAAERPPRPNPTYTIELASTVIETARLHDWLDGIFATTAMRDKAAHAIRLSLEESVTNVIMHGYGRGKPGAIAVRLSVEQAQDGRRVRVEVVDAAPAFDPTRAIRSTLQPPSDGGDPGGRGLALMRRFAEHMRYERTGDHNVLTLEFRC